MIEVNNLTTVSVDKEFLKKIAQKVLESENKKEADLSVALVGQGRMKELNKKYRGKNRVVDVLAFGENQKSKTSRPTADAVSRAGKNQKFPVMSENKLSLGEIVICLREVKKNAKKHKSTLEKELAKVLIHGILHLLEYDHEKSEEAAEEMKKKQNHYLSQVIPENNAKIKNQNAK